MASVRKDNKARTFAPAGVIFAVLGLALFAYFVKRAGVSQILEGIERLGIAFVLVLAISAVRHMARSLAWIKCFEPPYKLRFRDALGARLMGDALGNIVPLASVAIAEPSKAAFVRDRVPLIAGLSAIALENIFYSLSVAVFVFSGTTALLLSFHLPKALRYASIVALIVISVITPLGFLVMQRQWRFLSGALSFTHRRFPARTGLIGAVPRAKTLEDRIYGFYDRNRGALLAILALEASFHLAGIAEIYVVLWYISDAVAPTLLTAFILESVNRIINVAFKFVPLRTGVDEAGTGMLSRVLGFTTAIGVTLAIIRKARDIFWAMVGIALIVRKGLSIGNAAERVEEVVAEASSGVETSEIQAGEST